MPAPLRLQSVADSLSANEERYRVDMEELVANSDKFFEISTSANQHLDHLNNQLPTVSEAFEQTAYGAASTACTVHATH
jgi:ABC-type transporter Mla subunit MlaD